MVTDPKCPACGYQGALIGIEITGVYDGILYWECDNCGERFHRWPKGSPLRLRAAVRIGKE